MFGMGWQEILLILVVAVLVIGPDQLPQVARTIGRTVAQFRRLTNELRDTVNREFTENEDFREFREFHRTIDAEFRDIGKAAQNYVEKEIASEEGEELTKFAEEVRNSGKQLAEEGKRAFDAGKESLAKESAAAGGSEVASDSAAATAPADGTPESAEQARDTAATPGTDGVAASADKPPGAAAPEAKAGRDGLRSGGFQPPKDSYTYVPDEAPAASAAEDGAGAAAAEPAREVAASTPKAPDAESQPAGDESAHKETA